MLRLAAFLQPFHFWQADKAGFMWHRKKKKTCVLLQQVHKNVADRHELSPTTEFAKKILTEGQNFNNAIPLRTFLGFSLP